MSSHLQIVRPIPVTDARLVSSSIPETDTAFWNAATNYSVGSRVTRTTTHKVYQRVVAGTTATAPELDPVNWLAVAPTNRWRMFDDSNTTKSEDVSTISVRLQPGTAFKAIGVLGLLGSTLRIRVIDPVEGTVYDVTTPLTGVIFESTWYAYFFASSAPIKSQVRTDLPLYLNADVLVDVTPISGKAEIATLVVGTVVPVGLGIETGARVGITDYSRKETNAFGDTVLVQRSFAKRASFDVYLERTEVDAVLDMLTEIRATAVFWIGSEEYLSTYIFGFYKDFEIVWAHNTRALLNIELEGLT